MDRDRRETGQLRLPFDELPEADDPRDWPDPGACETGLPVDEEGLPLHPIALEVAEFLSRELFEKPLADATPPRLRPK